jgi:hypothetical protein
VLALGCSSGSAGSAGPDGAAPGDAPPMTADAPLPARLEVDKTQLEFMVPVGQVTSTPVMVWNRGGQDSGRPIVTVSGDGFYGSNEWCGEAGIRAGSSCRIEIGFRPMAPGTRMGTALLQGMPGGTISLSLIGQTFAAASLSLSSTQLTFPDTPIGAMSGSMALVLTNPGDQPLADVGLELRDRLNFALTTTCGGRTLAAHEHCDSSVVFTPGDRGTKRTTLTITAGRETRTVDVTGTGLSPAELVISPASTMLPASVGQSSLHERIYIGNAGEVPTGPITVKLSGSDPTEFETMTNCGPPLVTASACEVSVVFKPKSAGLKSASLVATSTPGGEVTASLTGDAR